MRNSIVLRVDTFIFRWDHWRFSCDWITLFLLEEFPWLNYSRWSFLYPVYYIKCAVVSFITCSTLTSIIIRIRFRLSSNNTIKLRSILMNLTFVSFLSLFSLDLIRFQSNLVNTINDYWSSSIIMSNDITHTLTSFICIEVISLPSGMLWCVFFNVLTWIENGIKTWWFIFILAYLLLWLPSFSIYIRFSHINCDSLISMRISWIIHSMIKCNLTVIFLISLVPRLLVSTC